MFARYFVELPLEADRVERALLREPQDWVPGLASKANHHGDALLAEVGFGGEVRLERKVAIEFGERRADAVEDRAPASAGSAAGPSGLFPALDADLEVAPLGHATPSSP